MFMCVVNIWPLCVFRGRSQWWYVLLGTRTSSSAVNANHELMRTRTSAFPALAALRLKTIPLLYFCVVLENASSPCGIVISTRLFTATAAAELLFSSPSGNVFAVFPSCRLSTIA